MVYAFRAPVPKSTVLAFGYDVGPTVIAAVIDR